MASGPTSKAPSISIKNRFKSSDFSASWRLRWKRIVGSNQPQLMWSHLKWNMASLPPNYLMYLHRQELRQRGSAEPRCRRRHTTQAGFLGLLLATKSILVSYHHFSLLLSLTKMLSSLQGESSSIRLERILKATFLSYKGINQGVLPDVGGWQSLMWVIQQNFVLRHYNCKHWIIWFVSLSSPSC